MPARARATTPARPRVSDDEGDDAADQHPLHGLLVLIKAKPLPFVVALLFFFVILLLGTTALSPSHTPQDTVAVQPTPIPLTLLEAPMPAFYGPGGDQYGIVDAGTGYEPVARFGSDWVQLELQDVGMLWVRSTDLADEQAIAALPDLQTPIVGYTTYVVEEGDSLHSIAARGGSDSALLKSYNHLQGEPVPGQPLIVPRLEGQASVLPSTPMQVERGDPSAPRVALTVDLELGDAEVTEMLNTLQSKGVRITFFVLGAWVEQHPELAKRIVDDGHEIANHSMSHANFRNLSNEGIIAELDAANNAILQATGVSSQPFMRFPYGAYDNRTVQVVNEQGYLPLFWSLDSQDALGAPKSADWFVERVTTGLPPEQMNGAIVLSHCCIRNTLVEALPAVLDRYAELGYEVVPISEVLGGNLDEPPAEMDATASETDMYSSTELLSTDTLTPTDPGLPVNAPATDGGELPPAAAPANAEDES
jgi:peptidoglycan/xylan/chitin deacetylase (PgdA/CDA1 family)